MTDDRSIELRTAYANIYRGNVACNIGIVYPTREDADKFEAPGRIACVELKFCDGQGIPDGDR